jgi:hypothetical protein
MKLISVLVTVFIACVSGDRASEIVYAILHRATAGTLVVMKTCSIRLIVNVQIL